jgi:hypothetical protein
MRCVGSTRGGLLTAHGLQLARVFLVVTARERLHNGEVFRPESAHTRSEYFPVPTRRCGETKRTITRVIGKRTQSRIWGSRYKESLSIACVLARRCVQTSESPPSATWSRVEREYTFPFWSKAPQFTRTRTPFTVFY